MITFIVAGFVALVAIAITVGVMDRVQSAAWRRVAAERRRRWEERLPLGVGGYDPDGDDD